MRIASLSPAVTEILFAIGAEERIVCVDKFSDEPAGVLSLPHLREHQAIVKVDVESYTPELIFTATLVQDRLHKELADERWHVVHVDPRSLSAIYDMIRSIGTLLDKEKEAYALAESMRREMHAVEKKAKLLPRRPRVYVEEWHHPPMVSGNWVPEMVKIAGGVPLNMPAGTPSRKVSLEEVRSFDPDVIVLSICGAGRLAEPALLTSRDGWADLRAVQSGNLRIIDDSLFNRPGPRLTDGAKRLYGWLFECTH